MTCELDDDEVMRLLEEINSDDSEIEDNIIEDFEEEDSDADPEYYPPAIHDEDIIENIINIQNEGTHHHSHSHDSGVDDKHSSHDHSYHIQVHDHSSHEHVHHHLPHEHVHDD